MTLNYTTTARSIASADENGRSLLVPLFVTLLFGLGLLLRYGKSATKSTTQPISQLEEPPTLTSSIPLIGHLIGMLRYQVGYMQMLRYGHSTPRYKS